MKLQRTRRSRAAELFVGRFLALTNGLKGESDRGCVVLAVAWIENDLTRLLKRHLLPSPKTSESSDELFGARGYLGTFSSKIDLAYRLGLIRRSNHQCLHLCRRIRNDFAHLSDGLSFSTPCVSDRVSEIFRLNEHIIQELWNESSENLLSEDTDIPFADTWDRSGDRKRKRLQNQIVGDLAQRRVPFFRVGGTLEARIAHVDHLLHRHRKFGNVLDLSQDMKEAHEP